jgi:anti-anti-sigma regulatory factor
MPGAHFVLTRVRGTLVVTLQNAADADTLRAASQALMEELEQRGAEGVVFEISGCEVIDLDEFTALRKLVQTVEWLGVSSVVAGLRPGIVAYLASAGAPTGSLRTSLNLEQALLKVKPTRACRRQ